MYVCRQDVVLHRVNQNETKRNEMKSVFCTKITELQHDLFFFNIYLCKQFQHVAVNEGNHRLFFGCILFIFVHILDVLTIIDVFFSFLIFSVSARME